MSVPYPVTSLTVGETIYEDYTQVESKISGPTRIKPVTLDSKDGTYKVQFTPELIGKYSVTVNQIIVLDKVTTKETDSSALRSSAWYA